MMLSMALVGMSCASMGGGASGDEATPAESQESTDDDTMMKGDMGGDDVEMNEGDHMDGDAEGAMEGETDDGGEEESGEE
jgi:hypothetical protein